MTWSLLFTGFVGMIILLLIIIVIVWLFEDDDRGRIVFAILLLVLLWYLGAYMLSGTGIETWITNLLGGS